MTLTERLQAAYRAHAACSKRLTFELSPPRPERTDMDHSAPPAEVGSSEGLGGTAAGARRIRVYRMDDMEWWAGESLADCIVEGRRQCGAECYPDAEEEGYELDDEQMQRLVFIDESDGAEPPVKRTFAEELARRVAAGEEFPQPFAAEDW